MKLKPFWDRQEEEILIRLKGMMQQGLLRMDMDSGKFVCNVSMDLDGPYLFTRPTQSKADCTLFWDIMWQHFKIIPSHCQKHCWKLVINFDCSADMFYGFQALRTAGHHGKCGYDSRPYTFGCWKGFVYNETREQGLDMLDAVRRDLLDSNIVGRPDQVILKRGCTEFEMSQPSDMWHTSMPQAMLEKKILSLVESVGHIAVPQPEWLERKRMRYWVKMAHAHGDDSYKRLPLELCKDIVMPLPPVTYERSSDGA